MQKLTIIRPDKDFYSAGGSRQGQTVKFNMTSDFTVVM